MSQSAKRLKVKLKKPANLSSSASFGENECLTPKEVAGVLHCTETHLFNLWRRGEGPPSFLVGKSRRTHRVGLDTWIIEKVEEDAKRRAGLIKQSGGPVAIDAGSTFKNDGEVGDSGDVGTSTISVGSEDQ